MSDPTPTGTLADNIRTAMHTAGIPSQRALAAAIDLDPTKLSKALLGKRSFTSLELTRIAQACDTTVDALLRTTTAPAEPAPATTRAFLSSGNVAARLGLSVTSITTRANDPTDRFPEPAVIVGNRFQGWTEESIDKYLAGDLPALDVDADLTIDLATALHAASDQLRIALPLIGYDTIETHTAASTINRAASDLLGEAINTAFTEGDDATYQQLTAIEYARVRDYSHIADATTHRDLAADPRAWAITQTTQIAASLNETAAKIPLALDGGARGRRIQHSLHDLVTDLYRHLQTPAAAAATAPTAS